MKKFFATCCALLLAAPIFAQKDDFGAWLEVEAEKKLSKKTDLTFGIGMRANDNLGEVSRANAFIGVSRKVCDYLKIGATYQYISDLNRMEVKEDYKKSDATKLNGYNVDESFHRAKHRFSFDLSSKVKVGRFTFSLRERYQFTHSLSKDIKRIRYRDKAPAGYSEPTISIGGINWMIPSEAGTDRKDQKFSHLLRSRIGVEYDIKGCPLTPFATYEIKTSLQDGGATEATRLIVGTDWKIDKKNTLSVAYLFDDGHYSDDANIHAVSVAYKFKF